MKIFNQFLLIFRKAKTLLETSGSEDPTGLIWTEQFCVYYTLQNKSLGKNKKSSLNLSSFRWRWRRHWNVFKGENDPSKRSNIAFSLRHQEKFNINVRRPNRKSIDEVRASICDLLLQKGRGFPSIRPIRGKIFFLLSFLTDFYLSHCCWNYKNDQVLV